MEVSNFHVTSNLCLNRTSRCYIKTSVHSYFNIIKRSITLKCPTRSYQPPPGKTVARDLSKSLSPTSEKKAKQLIPEYASNEGQGSVSDMDSDQWSSSQASFLTDPGEREDYSPLDNASEVKANNTRKSRIFSKLMSLSISTGNDAGTEGPRSEYATPSATSRTSFDFNRTMSLKEESGRNSDSHTPGSSKNFSARRRRSVDFKNCLDSFSESSGTEKSNLVKYAEAIKDSSGTLKHRTHRRSASYSSF
ncbi:hypothetical protein D0Y65_016579 [Glycine soja]|uniref:Uncharacterized protein n=1 Tax=Glycine soja TaxID=3848 RepID=A0A445JQR7_GLYSO|nr:hypothetical protein D0Y65_016579 [Glycine soja]